MGLTPHEYFCMSPLEFYYASNGYLNKKWDAWNRTRHEMYTVASTVKTKKRLPKITKWFPLPIDRLNTPDIKEERLLEIFKQLKEERSNGN